MKVPITSYSEEIVVRRSRFLARGAPLADSAAVRRLVGAVRASHPGCDHVVWAFVFGPAGESVGMSDDREPRGTAGRPVLEVLKGSGITNILLTVTRYFGGTKLGTGGLVRAYSQAARAVVSAIPVRDHVERRRFVLELPYESYEAVRRIAGELGATVEREEFRSSVTIEGTVPAASEARFAEGVLNLTAGRAEPRYL